MGKRLSKIYTKTGDDGTTGLGDGSRISKFDVRMELIGTIDEVNSLLGLLAAELEKDDPFQDTLLIFQHRLFDLGGELSIPGYALIKEEHVIFIETTIDAANEALPALDNFILPGGSKPAALCHLIRSVSRRAERLMVNLASSNDVNEHALPFINRFSDVFFVFARCLARREGAKEILWDKSR